MGHCVYARWRSVRLALAVMAVVISVSFGARAQSVSLAGRDGAELLRYVLEANRANHESLTTWKGKVTFKKTMSGEYFAKYLENKVTEGTIDYAVDVTSDSCRWNQNLSRTVLTKGGKTTEDKKRHFRAGVCAGNEYYRIGPEATDMSQRKRVYVLEDKAQYPFGPDDFIPQRRCFAGNTIEELYSHLEPSVQWLAEGVATTSIRRDGDLVTLRISVGQDIDPFQGNEFVFDLSKGCNLVKWYAFSNPEDFDEDMIDYAFLNGVWVPIACTFRTERPTGYHVVAQYQFQSQEVNGKLAPDEFTIAAIEAKPGDEIYDARSGTRYVYRPNDAPKQMPPVDLPKLAPEEVEEDTASLQETGPSSESGIAAPKAERKSATERFYSAGLLLTASGVIAAVFIGCAYVVTRRRRAR